MKLFISAGMQRGLPFTHQVLRKTNTPVFQFWSFSYPTCSASFRVPVSQARFTER